jgi:hypothetical protein
MRNQHSKIVRRALFALGLQFIGSATFAQSLPSPPVPSPSPASAVGTSEDLKELLRRLRDLETANQKLQQEAEDSKKLRGEFQDLSKKYEDLNRKLEGQDVSTPANAPSAATSKPAGSGTTSTPSDPKSGTNPNAFPGGGGVRNRVEAQQVGNRRLGMLKLKSGYNYEAAGFQFGTEDDELQLKVRSMLQIDAKQYSNASSNPLTSSFNVP